MQNIAQDAFPRLTEYRQALIASAVTGKIDMRELRHSREGGNPAAEVNSDPLFTFLPVNATLYIGVTGNFKPSQFKSARSGALILGIIFQTAMNLMDGGRASRPPITRTGETPIPQDGNAGGQTPSP